MFTEKTIIQKNKKSMFIVFFSTIAVCLVYLIGCYPGIFSTDVLYYLKEIDEITESDTFIDLLRRGDHSRSQLYIYLIYLMYLIKHNAVWLGIFQIICVGLLNAYCWLIVKKYTTRFLAWCVFVLMLIYPLNAVLPIWYHRSSLFALCVFLNVLLLYRIYYQRKLTGFENCMFSISVIAISLLRIDGLIISVISLVLYFRKSEARILGKTVTAFLFAAFLGLHFLLPVGGLNNFHGYFPFAFQVKRIYQDTDIDFQNEDVDVLESVVSDDAMRDRWLNGDTWLIDPFNLYKDDVDFETSCKYLWWSISYIYRNFDTYLKTQSEMFIISSLIGGKLLAFYYYDCDLHNDIREQLGIRKYDFLPFIRNLVNKMFQEMERPFYDKSLILKIISFYLGVAVPFFALMIYTLVGVLRKRTIIYSLMPLYAYCIFMYLFQPRPKGYYWYWLAYTSYFVIFVYGYEMFKKMNQKNKYETNAVCN
jgi:hypothetical protein